MRLWTITIALAACAAFVSFSSKAEDVSTADDAAESAAIIGKNEYYSETGQFQCPVGINCLVPFARVEAKKSLTTRRLSCFINHQRLINGFALARGPKKNSPDIGGAGLEKPAIGGANGNYYTGLNQDVIYKVPGGYFPILIFANSAEGSAFVSCTLAGDLR